MHGNMSLKFMKIFSTIFLQSLVTTKQTNKQTAAVPRDLVKQRIHKKDFTRKQYDIVQFEYTTLSFTFLIGVPNSSKYFQPPNT